MKLSELEAQFVGQVDEHGKEFSFLDSIEGAQGVMFVCPKCPNGHYILVWFANPRNAPLAPEFMKPSPRWHMSGTSLDDLTLHPSIDSTPGGGCSWHGWVQNGDAT